MKQPTHQQIQLWASRISRSDREAFDVLFRSFYAQLVHFACNYTKNKPDACDVVQDVFIKIWENRQEIDSQFSLKGYLYKMVRNMALNKVRNYSNKMVDLDLNGNEHHLTGQVEQETESGRLLDNVRTWIGELPERRREAFELSRFDGLDHEEIALIMEVSVNTVNNHIVSALKYLRDRHQAHNKKLT